MESFLGVLVGEGVEQRDGALEPLMHLVRAGNRKVDLAELLGDAVVVLPLVRGGDGGQTDKRQRKRASLG